MREIASLLTGEKAYLKDDTNAQLTIPFPYDSSLSSPLYSAAPLHGPVFFGYTAYIC